MASAISQTKDAAQYLDSIDASVLFDGMVGSLLRERPAARAQVLDCLIAHLGQQREGLGGSGVTPASPNGTPLLKPGPPVPIVRSPLQPGLSEAAPADPRRLSTNSAALAANSVKQSNAKKFSINQLHVSNWLPGVQPRVNPLKIKYPRIQLTSENVAVHINIIEAVGDFKHSTSSGQECAIVAGPAEHIYFEPSEVRAALLCTGGLCPGLNGIIRDVTMGLWNSYGVRHVYGIAYGFNGFDTDKYSMIELNPAVVEEIHQRGGSIIGCNRGGFDPEFIVDQMQRHGINQLYTLGGDGSLWTSDVLAQLITERRMHAVCIGIPKSIDNDVLYTDRTFGFHTAVEEGTKAISCAHVEATAVPRGVGICKLMGRDAGFVARNATLAVGSIVDLCLIPEVPFVMEDVKRYVDHVLDTKGHAVIVVAEGAGQHLMGAGDGKDSTGHTIYQDIGALLKTELNRHLKPGGGRTFLIDPSYMIRATAADPNDNMFCSRLGLMAAHSAMRGYNGVTVGAVHDKMVMIPTWLIAEGTRKVDPVNSASWQRLLEVTGMWECFAGQDRPPPKAARDRGHPSMYQRGGKFFDKMRAGGLGGTGT
eukprot:TRINITY_DN11632_c0_g1_i1.p1 TRINITY_DN11632_c0_g1~~TRINITY_DN11632_c0_g1_i1.p1  ORF type:complete len:592 (+),score=173.87 TRINITY_DN11632_c0_g1_i1:66-1841(+)